MRFAMRCGEEAQAAEELVVLLVLLVEVLRWRWQGKQRKRLDLSRLK
jgi:hypothetical protein